MKKIINIEEIVKLASEAINNEYQLIKGKKILFESRLENGESVVLLTPESKYHKTIDAGWVDITLKQYELMELYDNGIVVFRLEGYKMSMLKWVELKTRLTEEYMVYNKREGDHWKLHIHDNHIKVVGNKQTLKVNAYKHKDY
jgi:hypothetical protein